MYAADLLDRRMASALFRDVPEDDEDDDEEEPEEGDEDGDEEDGDDGYSE
jgi:hypothetical protein